MQSAVLARYPATHKLPVLAIDRSSAFEFLGIFNSTTLDFLVRGHMPGGAVALTWMLAQIPVPPSGLEPTISKSTERLSLTSRSVAQLFGQKPYAWNPDERYRLDVEIDSLVAHAYRVTQAQYATILDSFEVMAREQEKVYGRYKFKEDCLAAYRRVG